MFIHVYNKNENQFNKIFATKVSRCVVFYSIYQKKSVKQGGKFSLLPPCLARPLFFFSVFVFSQLFFYLFNFLNLELKFADISKNVCSSLKYVIDMS